MKRLYLSLDDRLFDLIKRAADEKGIPPTTLVVSDIENLYLSSAAVNYDSLLQTIYREAETREIGIPFLLSDLPSFSEIISENASKSETNPATLRARLGKTFNTAVSSKKVGNVVRAKTKDGELLNHCGVAMYVNKKEAENE